MPIACRPKLRERRSHCLTDCPAGEAFTYVRVEHPEDVPAPDDRAVDVCVLDMNHGWPNLGHDSIVHCVKDAACDLVEPLRGTGLFVRALSYDVRRSLVVPERGRYSLFLGTGGPAEIDPHLNDGRSPQSQGIEEDPSWEKPFFALLDSVRSDPETALLAVCHTFGVLCRWAGIARPILRGRDKGGKSSGLLENILTPEARVHPWFSRFSQELPDGRRFRVVDNRLFDLIPDPSRFEGGMTPISHETLGLGGPEGAALTGLEFARDPKGIVPRIFGVNHHPEILDRSRQMMILREKLERGEVTSGWYEERAETLTRTYPDEDTDQRLHITSDYTLLGPLRFHLNRRVRERAEATGLRVDVHEDRILEELDGAAVRGVGPARGSARA
ncbi:MAG TPA: hypothetical protein VN083_03325 [Vicinamibacteria bacterium]|nr:hypothetical protein [Vicinamibacteria bacterium]